MEKVNLDLLMSLGALNKISYMPFMPSYSLGQTLCESMSTRSIYGISIELWGQSLLSKTQALITTL
jgi:hypothetical protein